ncbi:MAG: S-layer homology domain-containing protein [Candidatus Cohnella colombiensis]|uniref:S-layer homology domain-containing protein n=1 Tax=Candidatus Cohnella colombiensis TaxID=3121368 RepID=A0AA95F023_9BACL|nr:MAG: S-layer homology domain-containing protein [Cohnella sp.]
MIHIYKNNGVKFLLIALAFLLSVMTVQVPKANAAANVLTFNIGNATFLIAGMQYPYSYTTDKASSTDIEWYQIEYRSADSNIWIKKMLVKPSDYPKYNDWHPPFYIPTDPSLTSVYWRITMHFNPLIGGSSTSSRTIGPFTVYQPIEPSQFTAKLDDKGNATISFNDNSNMESSYTIVRNDGKSWSFSDSMDYIGPLDFVDTKKKNADTVYTYELITQWHELNYDPNYSKLSPPKKLTTSIRTPPINILEVPYSNSLLENFSLNDLIKDKPIILTIPKLPVIPTLPTPPALPTSPALPIDPVPVIPVDLCKDNECAKGASTWAVPEIVKAVQAQLTTDTVLSDFQKDITREQFATMAVKLYEALSKQKAQLPAENPFKDTTNPEILKAYHLEIVNGVTKDSFKPDQSITRQEICVMLMRAIKVAIPSKELDTAKSTTFNDEAKIAKWAADAIGFAVKNNIMKGSNNKISPLDNTSREQAILLIYRTYESFR